METIQTLEEKYWTVEMEEFELNSNQIEITTTECHSLYPLILLRVSNQD